MSTVTLQCSIPVKGIYLSKKSFTNLEWLPCYFNLQDSSVWAENNVNESSTKLTVQILHSVSSKAEGVSVIVPKGCINLLFSISGKTSWSFECSVLLLQRELDIIFHATVDKAFRSKTYSPSESIVRFAMKGVSGFSWGLVFDCLTIEDGTCLNKWLTETIRDTFLRLSTTQDLLQLSLKVSPDRYVEAIFAFYSIVDPAKTKEDIDKLLLKYDKKLIMLMNLLWHKYFPNFGIHPLVALKDKIYQEEAPLRAAAESKRLAEAKAQQDLLWNRQKEHAERLESFLQSFQSANTGSIGDRNTQSLTERVTVHWQHTPILSRRVKNISRCERDWFHFEVEYKCSAKGYLIVSFLPLFPDAIMIELTKSDQQQENSLDDVLPFAYCTGIEDGSNHSKNVIQCSLSFYSSKTDITNPFKLQVHWQSSFPIDDDDDDDQEGKSSSLRTETIEEAITFPELEGIVPRQYRLNWEKFGGESPEATISWKLPGSFEKYLRFLMEADAWQQYCSHSASKKDEVDEKAWIKGFYEYLDENEDNTEENYTLAIQRIGNALKELTDFNRYRSEDNQEGNRNHKKRNLENTEKNEDDKETVENMITNEEEEQESHEVTCENIHGKKRFKR